jgi:hypothetical protein
MRDAGRRATGFFTATFLALTGGAVFRMAFLVGAAFVCAAFLGGGALPLPAAFFPDAAFFSGDPFATAAFLGAAAIFGGAAFFTEATAFVLAVFATGAAAFAFLRATAGGGGDFALPDALPVLLLAMASSRDTFRLKTVSTG